MSDIFRFEKCARCGTELPFSDLKDFEGDPLCPQCFKKAEEKLKEPCPYCGKRYKDLQRHLTSCKKRPREDKPAPPPPTPAVSKERVQELIREDQQVQALQTQVQDLRAQLETLNQNVQFIQKELPAHFKDSIKSLADSLRDTLKSTQSSPRISEGPLETPGIPIPTDKGSSLPLTVPNPKQFSEISEKGYMLPLTRLQVHRERLFPVDLSGPSPVLTNSPEYYLQQVLVKRRGKARRMVRAIIASGDNEKIKELFTPGTSTHRHFRQRLNWRDILVLALHESPYWFWGCHVFSIFVQLLGRSVTSAWNRHAPSGVPPPVEEGSYLQSFRALVWNNLDAWNRAGFEVNWADATIGRAHERGLAEWFVLNQNKPANLREIAEILKGRAYRDIKGSARSNVQRTIRNLVTKKKLLAPADPDKQTHREYILADNLQTITIRPSFWMNLNLSFASSEVVHLGSVGNLEDFVARFF